MDAPLGAVGGVLLGRLVAEPHAAKPPLHVLAVEKVPEEHLVACEGLPAGRRWQHEQMRDVAASPPPSSRGLRPRETHAHLLIISDRGHLTT